MTNIPNKNNITNIEFNTALSERYLSYALSTIMSRSLPDVRDGLKPVHRRLIYAMLQLNLRPEHGYKKCARIVGDVIGKYHPHGDTAVYDTLVRLAQNFSLRYPLIDGQGNFGSVDGDNAAAMRYTESRMTEIGTFLVTDIDKDTVDFRSTYDDSDTEPVLLPVMFPNLLANGSEGIAVGMATSIPPHNLHELCDALLHMIENPEAKTADILQFIQGPDFPTGGVIVEDSASIANSYEHGKGSFRVRARWHMEVEGKKQQVIVITEIPYQIQKAKLIEQFVILLKDKKLPLVANIRDESAEDIRVIIEPRAGCPLDVVMESIFKLTGFESRTQLNMNVIGSDNIPRVMSLVRILHEFLLHRKNIITRRSQFSIKKIEHRLEVLQGLKIAYLNLDEIIKIIREEDEPKQTLIDQFNITDIQAEAILNLRLRALRKLDEYEIIKEFNELEKQSVELKDILSNPKTMWRYIKAEVKLIQSKFGNNTEVGKRRTSFATLSNENQKIDVTSYIESEPMTIICSKMGWVRSVKGHKIDRANIKYKEGDEENFILEVQNTDRIIICSSEGKFFTIIASNINYKANGESLRLMVDIGDHEIVNIFAHLSNQKLLLASNNGKGFLVSADDVVAQTKLGKQIMTLSNSECIACIPVLDSNNMVAVTGTNRRLLVFALSEIPLMKRGQGVVLQKFKDAKLTDITIFAESEGLSWTNSGKARIEKSLTTWRAKRGAQGKLPPTGFPKDNKPFAL